MALDDMLIGSDAHGGAGSGGSTYPGIEKIRPRLIRWLSQIVDSLENEEGHLNLSLFQVVSLSGEQGVSRHTHDVDQQVDETVEEVLASAISDVEGVQYVTRVSYTVRVEGRQDRVNFTLEATNHQGATDGRRPDYRPDMEGVAKLNMDINLELVDRVVDLSTANTEDLRDQVRELRQENRLLKQNEWELRRQINALMNTDVQRRMMIREFEGDQRRKDQYANAFQQLLPVGANVAFGPAAGQVIAQLQALAANAMGGGMPGPAALDDGGAAGTALEPPVTGSGPGGAMTETDRIDRFVALLKERDDLLGPLMGIVGQEPQAMEDLLWLINASMERRAARAQNGGGGGNGSGSGRRRKG